MDCTAWRFWTMRQSNGCSTPVPRSSAAKQWLEQLVQKIKKKRTPRVDRSKKQGSKIHSALEQRRSQLQKQAQAVRQCLVDYEFSSPAGVRRECRTRSLSYRNNRELKFTQPWNRAAHNCKSSFRKCLFECESSRVHMAYIFGLLST